MIGTVFVSPHARQRWRERINPGASDEQALRQILEAFSTAHRQRVDENGTEHWRASSRCRWGRVRIRVRPGEGELPTIVTVIPEHDRWETRGQA